ncbi:MAG: hypothetical protein WKF37_06455, partial [Bryobacteraceae bacterium]
KHYLIDFGSTLGSASSGANSPRSGFEQHFTWASSAKEFFTLGFYVPKWSRIDYPNLRSVGRFSAKNFDPVRWTPEYPNPAFNNRLPEDVFWAARQVAMFTDEEIRAAVKTGEYSDPVAEKYVADTIIARRDRVKRAYLSRALLLDNIQVVNGRVRFDDLGVMHGNVPLPDYRYEWFRFDNEVKIRQPGASSEAVPAVVGLLALDVRTQQEPNRHVTIYLKPVSGGHKVIGIDRID